MDDYQLLYTYKGNKILSKDRSLHYSFKGPFVFFSDKTSISLETGLVIEKGSRFLDGTIKLELSLSISESNKRLNMGADNLQGISKGVRIR